ncbi:MAG: TIGR01841 family phasin [Acetobacteraceae bacterium]|nr:TIGR01841 family phasin [Acetobacteraceae bacterium]
MPTPAETKKAMAEAAQVGATQAKKIMEDGATQARVAVEKGFEQATKTAEGVMKVTEEAVEFARGNLDAVTKATQVYVAGVQDLSRQTLAMLQALTDHSLEGMKAITAARSLKEATDLQTSFARTGFERAMNDAAKLQEASIKLAEQSFAPLSARVTVAVEKMAKPLAA